MYVELIAHTRLSEEFITKHLEQFDESTPGEIVTFTAIRTCYSPTSPTIIYTTEKDKYFTPLVNGKLDAHRLFDRVIKSHHLSVIEHINFTFAIEDVSRSLLAQLTRHRHMSFSVQSQRYVKMGSLDKSEGFSYTVPPSISNTEELYEFYIHKMEQLQNTYDELRAFGVPAEDARFVLPNATNTNLILTANLRTFLEFYHKRKEGSGAQWEIAELANNIKWAISKVEPWTEKFFVEE